MNDNSDIFQEHMIVYDSKNPLTRNLFWGRINTAIKFAQLNDDSILLDIGCNTGHLLKTIRKFNASCQCWGVDVEPKIMTLQIENCNFKVADAKNLPFTDGYFDVIFVLDILEHIQDVERAIKEIHRVLKTNGLVILSGPTESWFYKFCRFLQFGQAEKNVQSEKPGFRGEIDFHFHTVYNIEKYLLKNGFRQLKQKSLPGFPIPTLFRITAFQK